MNDKLRITIGLLAMVSVIAALVLYSATDKSIGFMGLVSIVIIPLILVFGALYALKRRVESVKSGLPMEDELSKNVTYRAGYYAYLVSTYVALAGMFLELEGSLLGAAVILISAVVFMGSHIYLEHRGGA